MSLEIDPLQWLLVFLGMTMLDVVWSLYTRAVASRARELASGHAVLIILITGFVTKFYVDDLLLLVPAACGAFAGTWLSFGRK